MHDPAERCETCRFFDTAQRGICRRYAPRAATAWLTAETRGEAEAEDYAQWPIWPGVVESEWCGEWEWGRDRETSPVKHRRTQ